MTEHAGVARVGAAAIQVTRSLGDFDARRDGLTPEPEVTATALGPADEFVVIACDGVWDVLSSAEAVALVQATVKEPSMCAKRVLAEAMTRGSRDNLTVVVAFLRPVSTLESIYRGLEGAATAPLPPILLA